MFRRILATIALVATAVLATTLLPGDAFARRSGGGGHVGHAASFRGVGGHHAVAVRHGVGGYHAVGVRQGAVGIHNNVVVGRRATVLARGGAYRVGGRYHGGIWYGTGRHWWNGRWYAYGVGPCWLWSPIGYVWVCG